MDLAKIIQLLILISRILELLNPDKKEKVAKIVAEAINNSPKLK